jgi:maltose/moltooligosaccharide transporter
MTKHVFFGHAVKTLMLGGVCMLVAAVLTMVVQDNADSGG